MKPVLIIGGGISGITAAVELAEAGKDVVLVEKDVYLGGNVSRMNNYFPKLCPPSCGLEINFRRIRINQRIKYFTSTTVFNINGKKGDFSISLLSEPQYVKNNCTCCGDCVEVCPVERPDNYNFGLSETKAIYLPHNMAFPMKYSIDGDYCRKEECSLCADVCSYDAIDLKAWPHSFEIQVSAVLIATGWKNYDAGLIDNLHYSEFQDVITNVEFERLIAMNGPGKGKLKRPSDGMPPEEIAFVQCAGSRDENHLPYCSAVCCSASLKHALTISEIYPDIKVKIFYIDLRVAGRNEDFLRKVEEKDNIELIKGKVAVIKEAPGNTNLIVEAEDIMAGKKMRHETSLVVLATGIQPLLPNIDVECDDSGFLHGEQKEGIYALACCRSPMDVASSVKEATGACLKAMQ